LLVQNFRGRRWIGQDVVAALKAELAAEGLPGAVLPAVVNDTVATLVGASGTSRLVAGGRTLQHVMGLE
jgi:hexokinase